MRTRNQTRPYESRNDWRRGEAWLRPLTVNAEFQQLSSSCGWLNHQAQPCAHYCRDHCRGPKTRHLDGEHHQHKPGKGKVIVVEDEAKEIEQPIKNQAAKQEEDDVYGFSS